MEKTIQLNEEQLRNAISKTIESVLLSEGIDEVNWFKRAGNAVRNAYDSAKTAVGGAAAGLKAGLKYGGTTAAVAGAGDYKAQRNANLAASRQQEADAAIAEFRKEYGQKVGELNRWKANEIRQIKQMYGADAFAKKASDAQASAASARADRAAFNQYDLNTDAAAKSYKQVSEMAKKTKINEKQLRSMINKAINEAIDEINGLTADSAYVKAKQQYDQLVAAGQGNTPQAAKLQRQIAAFKAYNDFDTDGTAATLANKNAYGNSAEQYYKDIAGAYGMKNFNPQQFQQTYQQMKANGGKYDPNTMSQGAMNQYHQFSNLPYVKNQNYNNMQSPQALGLQYNQGKKGFLGMGKQQAGWAANSNATQNQVAESIDKIVDESIKKVLG